MKTALVYSQHSENTAKIVAIINDYLKEKITEVNVENASFDELLKYDLLILGISTWFDGELPNYWDEYLPGLEELDFSGKKVAIFGLGNQAGYPENYQDAMGILADFFKSRGAEIIGYTSADSYSFECSLAVKDGQFCGLAIDTSFPAEKTKKLIEEWVDGFFGQG